jgi:hypothetical protein
VGTTRCATGFRLKQLHRGADVLLMEDGAPDGFTIGIETGWDPPSRRSQVADWIDAAGSLLEAALGPGATMPTATGDPRWRVVLKDDEEVLAASRWSQDYQGIEHLQAGWLRRIAGLTATEIRSRAHRWAGEEVPSLNTDDL